MEAVPTCPVCGEECETIFLQGREAIGCENCVDTQDAYDWAEDQRQQNYDAYVDSLIDEAIEWQKNPPQV